MDAATTAARRHGLPARFAAALTLATVSAVLAISPSPAAACTAVSDCGRLIVEVKIVGPVEPVGAAETKFNFSADFDAAAIGLPDTTPNAFTLSASKVQTVDDLRPGSSYSLKQTNVPALSGYDISGLACTESGAAANTPTTTAVGPGPAPLGQTPPQVGTATLHVDAGELIVCTYTNTRKGRIVIAKDTLPDLDITKFLFTTNISRFERFAIADNDSQGIDVVPGLYTVTEAPAPGWELYELTCDPEVDNLLPRERSVDLSTGTATLDIKAGKSITCRFKNRKTAHLVVEKRTLPTGDSTSFDFQTSARAGTFALSDRRWEEFYLSPGTYSVTENAKAGWELTGLTCDDVTSTIDLAARTATVDVSRGELVFCTFTNSKLGALVVETQTLPAGAPTLFDFLTTAPGAPLFKLADGANERRDVRPGTYTALQAPAIGFRLDSLACADVDSTGDILTRVASFRVQAGETVTCTFVNRAIASAVAVKSDGQEYVYAGDPLPLTFTVTNSGESPLTGVQVGDDRCAPVTVKRKQAQDGGADKTPSVLDLSDTWIYECVMTAPGGGAQRVAAPPDPLLNTVTVDASDEFARSVSASDSHATRIVAPAIRVVTDGPATAVAGEPVSYTLAVTNPGDTPFLAAYVSTSDALCDAPPLLTSTNGDATPSQHDPGDTWTYACTVQTQLGQTRVDNVGKVTARDSIGGREVTDTDPATTQLTQPGQLLTPKRAAPTPGNPRPGIPAPRTPAASTPPVTARLRGPSGCVTRPFRVTVSGHGIARVQFLLDGKRQRRITVRGDRTVFSIKIDPRRQSTAAHRVSALVHFRAPAKPVKRTLRLVYVSCPRGSVPRFAG